MVSALFVFGYAAVFIVPVLSCRPKEYKTNDGQCCPMCNEGTVVQRDCTAYSGTRCRSCEQGTFMNQPNGLHNCFTCTSCDTGHGLSVKRNCTAKTDTVCDVLNGYHCKGLTDSNGCSLAEKHSQCAAGQRIKEPGTSRSDTVCEDCQPGFFSKDGVSCTAWKICSESQIKVKEGSSTSDVVCGSASRHHYFCISSVVLFLVLVICFVITGFVKPGPPMMSEAPASWPDGRMRTLCPPSLLHFASRSDTLLLMMASAGSGLTVRCRMYTDVHSCLAEVPLQSSVEGADQPSPIRFSLLDAHSMTDKQLILNDLFIKESSDFMLLTETLQQDMDHVYFEEMWTAGISIIVTQCLPALYQHRLTSRLMNSDSISSFKLQMILVGSLKTFYCILIYQPPGVVTVFSAEFGDLSSCIITLEKVVILRYCNLHIDGSCNSAAHLITESFNFKHHVSGPTHLKGLTLDLAFSQGLKTNNVCVENVHVRDHSCIFFSLSFVPDPSFHKLVIQRWIINQDPAEMFPAFFDAIMTQSDVDTFILSFNNECKSTFDTLGPLKQRIVQCSSFCTWITEHIYYFRRYLYKLEHLWKAFKLPLHGLHVKESVSSLNDISKNAKIECFSNLIASERKNLKFLFDTIKNFVSHDIPHARVFLKSECNEFFVRQFICKKSYVNKFDLLSSLVHRILFFFLQEEFAFFINQ